MSLHYEDAGLRLWQGSNKEILPTFADASFDSIVTDPPYELGFMGKGWDSSGIAYDVDVWRECLRVLKPGGHLLAFGGTRTWHRVAVAIEDAGFEIRDSIAWLYGSGFPKSMDVSKAIDKAAGAERKKVRKTGAASAYSANAGNDRPWMQEARVNGFIEVDGDEPATDAAREWEGWGTALKPAFEPVVVARKPLIGTVAANVLEHGTGALNIDATRIGDEVRHNPSSHNSSIVGLGTSWNATETEGRTATGRWPANVVLDESQADALDAQTGITRSTVDKDPMVGAETSWFTGGGKAHRVQRGDTGGASRFFPTFRYEEKAPTSERPNVDGTVHATVKPLELMRWLIRLVTRPGGRVLDPFAGSGTTGEAALLEGMEVDLIELEADHLPLIMQRVRKPLAVGLFTETLA